MSDLLFFDAFTQIGPWENKHPAHPWRLADLLAEMDHCSISGALVSSRQSVTYDAMHSNRELSAALKPHDHLFAIWNVMPHQTGECPAPGKLEAMMREHGVRAVLLCPKSNAWDWGADHAQVLLGWLARRDVLTIVPRAEFSHYRELDGFLERHPHLSVLLTDAHWAEQRFVLPLLRKYRHLHISFDQFQIHYGIEDLVAQGLENQLVYASNALRMAMGAHRAYVDWAEISLNVRCKIAGGNLARLLGGVAPPRLRINHNEDEIMAAARRGIPLPTPVLDMHMHILDEGMNGAGGAYRMHRGGPSGVFALLRRLGCVGGGFMSWNGTVSCDSQAGNRCVTAALDVAPRGYWGLGTFDPTHFTKAEMGEQIRGLYADRRFIGMKPYRHFGVEYHHRSYEAWWSYGNQRGLYALIHRTRNDFVEVEKLAKKYPRVRWVVAHCGSDYRTADQAIACMKQHPNVYAEITLTPVPHGIIDHLVEHAGADRVVYGSDLPMRDPRQQLGWVVFSRLSLSAKKRVLSGNARRIIRPCLMRLPEYNRPSSI